MSEENHKKRDWILALLLLLAAGVAFYFSMQDEIEQKFFAGAQKDPQELVNKHITIMSKKIELEKLKAEIENKTGAPQVGVSILPVERDNKNYGVDHTPESAEVKTYQDINRDKKELRYFSPNAQIQGEVHNQEVMQQYEDEYKRAYAAEFLENARKNGYEVTLDNQYRVISVKKIKKAPAGNQILPNEGGGIE